MATAAPKNDTAKPADHLTVIAAGAVSNVDLTAVSRRPKHAAQKIKIINCETTVQPCVFRGEDDVADTTVQVPIGGQMEIETPVRSLTSAGTNVAVHCYWWAGFSPVYNK